MTDELHKRRIGMGWGIPASILLHVVFAFVLFFHLPLDFSEPEKEESVNVELVPSPEEPEQQADEAQPTAEEEQPSAEAAKEEPPPPPAEPPAEEEAKVDEPPPPPPEAVPVAPPDESPPEEQSPADEQARGQPIPVLRPVFEYGEEDAGPRKSEDGNASTEAGNPVPASRPEEKAAGLPKPAENEPPAETPLADPVPEIELPEVDVTSPGPGPDGAPAETSTDATEADTATAEPQSQAAEEASDMPNAEDPVQLTEATTLFSQSEAGGVTAMTAMGNVPRGVRAGQLCATELREQLRHASPTYRPELLPAYRLPSGTVLEVQRGAFRTSAEWFDLSFRCEVDEGATKVVSFAFDVGPAVPRSEWRKRGFPDL